MSLTDDQKKRLTMFLGECWHEDKWDKNPVFLVCACGALSQGRKNQKNHFTDKNRTFTTWQDLGDLKEKLEEKGMWEKFYNYCAAIHHDENTSDKRSVVRFTAWLMNPATVIPLVAEFLEVQDARSKGNP